MTNTRQFEVKARRQANKQLSDLCSIYHDGLPIRQIDEILTASGFNKLEDAIYCGRDARMHEQVGAYTWFSMTWHKFDETGRYEIVAYLS